MNEGLRRFGVMAAAAVPLLGGTAASLGGARTAAADTGPETVAGQPVALTLESDGEATVKLDGYYFNLVFPAEGATAAEATAAWEKKAETLKTAVQAAGVARLRVRSGGVFLTGGGRYRIGDGRIEMSGSDPGQAIQTVARVIARVREAGVPDVVGELSFTCDDATERKARPVALKHALDDAAARARLFAETAKPRQLRLLTIGESEYRLNDANYRFSVASDEALPNQPRERTLRVTVTLRYGLADPGPPARPATKSDPKVVAKPTAKPTTRPAPQAATVASQNRG